MNLKNGKVFTRKFVGTGPSSYEKIIYRVAVSQRPRNTGLAEVLVLQKMDQWANSNGPEVLGCYELLNSFLNVLLRLCRFIYSASVLYVVCGALAD